MVNLIIPTLLVSAVAFVTSIAAIVLVLAQKWSTHKIEWRPLVAEAIKDEILEEQDNVEEQDAEILSKAYIMQRSSKKSKPDQDPLDDILKSHNF
jgi:hypothetical protein